MRMECVGGGKCVRGFVISSGCSFGAVSVNGTGAHERVYEGDYERLAGCLRRGRGGGGPRGMRGRGGSALSVRSNNRVVVGLRAGHLLVLGKSRGLVGGLDIETHVHVARSNLGTEGGGGFRCIPFGTTNHDGLGLPVFDDRVSVLESHDITIAFSVRRSERERGWDRRQGKCRDI